MEEFGQTSRDPTERVLRLLSALQNRRQWPAAELAERFGVTERTIRRDVDRLRELGYPVDATPGRAGGYRLGTGAHLPPLMFGRRRGRRTGHRIAHGRWCSDRRDR